MLQRTPRQGWGLAHGRESQRRSPCVKVFQGTLLSAGNGSAQSHLSHCPHLTYPDVFSPLVPINQNEAFCVRLVLSPIRVWKFSCSFPSIFCHSSELVKWIKGKSSQPRKAAELATGGDTTAPLPAQTALALPLLLSRQNNDPETTLSHTKSLLSQCDQGVQIIVLGTNRLLWQ